MIQCYLIALHEYALYLDHEIGNNTVEGNVLVGVCVSAFMVSLAQCDEVVNSFGDYRTEKRNGDLTNVFPILLDVQVRIFSRIRQIIT